MFHTTLSCYEVSRGEFVTIKGKPLSQMLILKSKNSFLKIALYHNISPQFLEAVASLGLVVSLSQSASLSVTF